jgi:hypothetical protein
LKNNKRKKWNEKMNKKIKVSTIVFILILTIPVEFVALPAVYAQTKQTYAFLGIVPNLTGVNQPVTLHIGITHPTAWPHEGWEKLTVTVTNPDGSTETLGPYKTDTTGGTGVTFYPEQVGTYRFQTHFPEQVIEVASQGIPVGTIMLASNSDITVLQVQDDPIEYYPSQPFPKNFWTRPIDSQLREWSTISGNWLMPMNGLAGAKDKLALSNDYAPESAHILWTKDLAIGGLVGGSETNDWHSYSTGNAYEGLFTGAIILNGVLYFNRFESLHPTQDVVAVDLHTGEELWVMNWDNTALSFGQILHWENLTGHGSYAFLWANNGSNWNAYDPKYGTWVYGMTNVPEGTNYFGPNGEIYKYTIENGRLLRWNSVWAMKWDDNKNVYSTHSFISGQSRLIGTIKDASHGYDLNITIRTSLPGRIAKVFVGDKVIGADIGDIQTTVWGLSLERGKEGTLLFNATWFNPTAWIAGNQTLSWEAFSPEVGILWATEVRQHYGVSFETGELIWGPTQSQNYRDQYYQTGSLIAYGNLYSSGLGGTLYCYNVSTGDLQWNCDISDKYFEFKISPNWWLYNLFAADGKLYVGHYERSARDPKPRGAPFICFNATTGDIIWRIDGAFRQTMWGNPAIIGDSIIATMDTYDQRIYAIGKGPSAISITAPDIGVSLGSSIIIKGRVTDRSPGTDCYALKARFPNGVPAIADEYMSEWMLHVYKQFPCPVYTEGVEIILETFDSDGEYNEIGRITSDSSGFYSLKWKPPTEGKYIIVARFEGTESYWGSCAETAISVDPAPSPENRIQPEPTVIGISEIAIIAAVTVVSLVIFVYWALKRNYTPAKNM